MEIQPIAFFSSPLREKFGVPRQSGVVDTLRGHVVFEPKYAVADALRGLEGFDYVWLIWGFHRAIRQGGVQGEFHATVRPPRLGGNERMGVFATRSPFRPNGLGLSSVRLGEIGKGRVEVFGADLMDGTPIYDVKPYLPAVDSHVDARGGFTMREWKVLNVDFPDEIAEKLTSRELSALRGVLEQDPRPHYHADAERVYGMAFGQYDVRFTVAEGRLSVVGLERQQ